MTNGTYKRSWISTARDKDGYYQGTAHVGWKASGEPDIRHRQRKNKKELRGIIEALERARDEGDLLAAGAPPKLAQWLDQWLADEAGETARARTLESYESIVRLHLKPRLGHHRLDQLQEEHIRRCYQDLMADGLAASTVKRVHSVLSSALRLAHDRQRIKRNYCAHVRPPKGPPRRHASPLTAEEVRLVLDAASGTRNGERWTLGLATGMRQSEVLGLAWDDLDLEVGTARVRRGLHRLRGKGLTFQEPKSKASERVVPLPEQLVKRLRVHAAAQAQERAHAGSEWQDWGLVFAQPNGRPIDRRADYRSWLKLLKAAGVGRRTVHDGRHTTATLLLEQGVPSIVIADVVGHADSKTTEKMYMQVRPPLAQRAASAMEAVMFA